MKPQKRARRIEDSFKCPWCMRTLKSREGAQVHIEDCLCVNFSRRHTGNVFDGFFGRLFGTAPRHQLQQRPEKSPEDMAIYKEILEAGYKQVARKLHPDVPGGDEEKFKRLQGVMESLKQQGAL